MRNILKTPLKIWVDDIRPAPAGYIWLKSVNETIRYISNISIFEGYAIELIDLDHDAGDYAKDGGDYVRILDYLELVGYNGDLRIHSMNAVGKMNMRNIIQKNGWREIY